jgi:hypothetical protein
MSWHGKIATATFGGNPFSNILGWSCTLNAGTADSTAAHATLNNRTRTVGFKSGTATVSTYQNSTQNATIGEEATLVLKRKSDVTAYTGEARCTNIENGQDKNGNATTNYSFVWQGAVTNS